jgi:hypothetical protein
MSIILNFHKECNELHINLSRSDDKIVYIFSDMYLKRWRYVVSKIPSMWLRYRVLQSHGKFRVCPSASNILILVHH